MRNVGIDIQILQSGEHSGYGYYLSGLYQALEKQAPQSINIVGLTSKWERDLSTVERFWHDRFEVPRVAAKAGVDILHQPAFSAPKSNKNVIWTLHDLRAIVRNEAMSLPASLYWKKWLPYSSRYADVIVCTSENTRQDAVKVLGLNPDTIPIIPVGVPQELVDWTYDEGLGRMIKTKFKITEPFFSSVGTIQPIKNYPFLIDVFVALRQEYKLKHQLVIIGKKGWDYDAVVARLKQHNLEEGKEVIITGYVTDDEKWSLVHQSEAFLFPSLYEGFGIPPLEAQALSVPVLAANNSSIPGVVGDGALLCSDSEVTTWLNAYEKLTREKKTLLAAGKQNITHYYWNAIADQWLKLYQTL